MKTGKPTSRYSCWKTHYDFHIYKKQRMWHSLAKQILTPLKCYEQTFESYFMASHIIIWWLPCPPCWLRLCQLLTWITKWRNEMSIELPELPPSNVVIPASGCNRWCQNDEIDWMILALYSPWNTPRTLSPSDIPEKQRMSNRPAQRPAADDHGLLDVSPLAEDFLRNRNLS